LKAIIDTNVLIFDTFEDSEFHREAVSGLDSLEKWLLPGIVFHELVWFFRSRKIGPSRARMKVEEYLTNEKTEFLNCTADDVRYASSRMTNYSQYNDLLVLSAAARLEVALFSFDEDLKKSARHERVKLLERL